MVFKVLVVVLWGLGSFLRGCEIFCVFIEKVWYDGKKGEHYKGGAFMKNKNCKYIFVTGGVLSGVGKGITAASIGTILKAKGYKVSIQKCDPYLNVDAGKLNPLEHGECFVTKDGCETDLDLGHYERFLDIELTKRATTLSGGIFKELIERQEGDGFDGRTVQMIPHFTGILQERIKMAGEGSEVHIVEIGGTVGDFESMAFIEAIRRFALEVGRENCLYVHVVYVPWINTSKEFKTKPAQNAMRDLRGFGIIPDVVCARTEKAAGAEIMAKIADFSGISRDAVVNLPDIKSVYDVPRNILKSGVEVILDGFMEGHCHCGHVGGDSRGGECEGGCKCGCDGEGCCGARRKADLKDWLEFSKRSTKKYEKTVRIGIVTDYLGNDDVYISVTEALKAAAAWERVNVDFEWILRGEEMDFAGLDGVIEPEGFLRLGERDAAVVAMRSELAYLGLGDEKGKKSTGEHKIYTEDEDLIKNVYKINRGGERVELGERYRFLKKIGLEEAKRMEKLGLVAVATVETEMGKFGEFIKRESGKEFFLMCQAHPEYKSRPLRAHPIFVRFMREVIGGK